MRSRIAHCTRMPDPFFFFFSLVLFHLKEGGKLTMRAREADHERERERESEWVLPPGFLSPDILHCWDWTRSKQESVNSARVFHMDSKDPLAEFWPKSLNFYMRWNVDSEDIVGQPNRICCCGTWAFWPVEDKNLVIDMGTEMNIIIRA